MDLTELPPGARTGLGILRLQGAQLEDRGDHLVVRSPRNPEFHWGNYLHVTTGDVEDADRWVGVFRAEFPDARHVAIGLPKLPQVDRYAPQGISVTTDDALSTTRLPEQRPLADGYTARPLAGADDWEQVVRTGMAENAATGEYDPVTHERYLRGLTTTRRALVEAGHACFFGAFAGGMLVSDLGIVILGDTARYQSVGTAAAHRRRGLAGHLLGLAARWAADRGAREWVIVTESTNDAGRLYRSVGFTDHRLEVAAYRPPPHE